MPQDLTDRLSEEDLRALEEAHRQLAAAKDPRSLRVAKYLQMQYEMPPAEPDKPGFFSTIGNVISQGPKGFMDFVTGHPIQSIVERNQEVGAKAKKAFSEGNYGEGAGYFLGGMLPGVGDQAIQAGEEFGRGNVGGGAANTLLALGPSATSALAPVASRLRSPVTVGPPRLVSGGGIPEIPLAGLVPKGTRINAAVRVLNKLMDTGEIRPASTLQRLEFRSPLTPPPVTRTPLPELFGAEATPREVPGPVNPVPATQFPSGRVPGNFKEPLTPPPVSPNAVYGPGGEVLGVGAEPEPIAPVKRTRPLVSITKMRKAQRTLRNLGDEPTEPPTVEPIPPVGGMLPSGRRPGPVIITPNAYGPPTAAERPPLWKTWEAGPTSRPPADFAPIPGTLPSGRVPGSPGPLPAPPPPPAPAPPSITIPTVEGIDPAYLAGREAHLTKLAADTQRKAKAIAAKIWEAGKSADAFVTEADRREWAKKAGYTRPFSDKTGDATWVHVVREFDKLR